MSARRRTDRDWRRRQLGQNFLDPATADQVVEQAAFAPGELVLEIGAGSGALTRALVRRTLRVIAVEPDPAWAKRLRDRGFRVIEHDFLSVRPPREPFRVFGSLPFARTTDILHRLLDDPATPMHRADVIVQWEVAVKRAIAPPVTLVSTAWAPWWEMQLARRIPAAMFRIIRHFCRSRWRVVMPTSSGANGRSSRRASARALGRCRKSLPGRGPA